jgi:multidrug transporter EmrE-like cation transporter
VVAGGGREAPARYRVRPAIGDDRSQRLPQLAGSDQVELGWSGDGQADGGAPCDEPGGAVEAVGTVGMVAGVQERRQDREVFRAHVTSVIDMQVLSDTSKTSTLVSYGVVEKAVDVSLGWMFLVAAIVGDTIGTIALERSDGMRRALPAAASVVAYLAAVVSFGAAIERVPISVADAVYAAGSTTLITSVAIGLGRERLDTRKGLGLALVVVGVAVLRLDGAV